MLDLMILVKLIGWMLLTIIAAILMFILVALIVALIKGLFTMFTEYKKDKE